MKEHRERKILCSRILLETNYLDDVIEQKERKSYLKSFLLKKLNLFFLSWKDVHLECTHWLKHSLHRPGSEGSVSKIYQVFCLQCSKFSKSGFSNMWTVNFQMFKLDLEKAEEPETKLPTSTGSSKKQESSRKTSISALLTIPKPLTVWITINCGKFWKRWEYQSTWPASWETYM